MFPRKLCYGSLVLYSKFVAATAKPVLASTHSPISSRRPPTPLVGVALAAAPPVPALVPGTADDDDAEMVKDGVDAVISADWAAA